MDYFSNKNNWTLGKRLWILSLSLIILIGVIGLVPFEFNLFYSSKIKNFSEVLLPSIKDVVLSDMFRDTIRLNATEIELVLETKKMDKLPELVKEEHDNTKAFLFHLNNLTALGLSQEAEVLLKSILVDAKKYVEYANRFSELAEQGHLQEIQADFPEFLEVFGKLDISIPKLIILFENYSKNHLDESNSFRKNATIFNVFILVCSLLVGVVFSLFIIKKLNKDLNYLVYGLTEETQKISQAAMNLEMTSSDLSELTKKQGSAIAQTAASMEEMSSMLTQTSKHSANNMSIVDEGQMGAKNGMESINQMLSAMDSIQASNAKLEAISNLIVKIANKTKIINEIVSETRLLSFNASIEAARAGVHGKGFAVVAEEVGKLATMSGSSANEIRELLESSTIEVAHVVADIRERIATGKNIFKECETSFDNMRGILAKITEATKVIVSSTKEQELGVKQTTFAMRQMDQVTQRNSSIAETQANDAKLLTTGLEKVQIIIRGFHALIIGNKKSHDLDLSQSDSWNKTKDSGKNNFSKILQETSINQNFESSKNRALEEHKNNHLHQIDDGIETLPLDIIPKRDDSRWKA